MRRPAVKKSKAPKNGDAYEYIPRSNVFSVHHSGLQRGFIARDYWEHCQSKNYGLSQNATPTTIISMPLIANMSLELPVKYSKRHYR